MIPALLGPALILALAAQGTFCLHSSAVELKGRVIAFVGPSGIGKSTLARLLPEADWCWARAADDILPVTADPKAVWALPHYPQLKLGPGFQAAVTSPDRLPLVAVYVLEPADVGAPGAITIRDSRPRDAALDLLRHTVASRLFAASLLSEYLSFGIDTAQRIPVRRLSYPRCREIVPRLGETIMVNLGLRR